MKKRFVGAAVIISLLVILMPLAFKGPVEQTTDSVPLIRFQPPFEEMAIPDEKTVGTKEAEDLFAQEESTKADKVPKPEPAAPDPIPNPVAKTQPVAATKVPEKAVPKPAAVKAQLTTSKEGWVVQVGSFESLAKAKTVQEFFKSKQVNSVIKEFKLGTKVYHRVRLMPPENKSKAEALAKKISESYKNIDTLVFPYDS